MSKQLIKVLCVEDDDLDRMIIKRAVKSSGLNIDLIFAENMESGKELTKDATYDCIFLDYSLPDGSGVELLKYIREQGNLSPVIVVTSQGDEKIAVEVMKNGAQDYIPKNLLSAEGLSQSLRFVMKMKENELEKQRIERELQETQKRLQTVVANSPIILFLLDEKGTFTLFEGKEITESVVGMKEMVGKNINDVPAGVPIFKSDFEEAMKGFEKTSVHEVKDKFFEIYYSPVRNSDNTVRGVIGVASDVTNHVLAEKELTNAKHIAEEAAAMKEQFLANMSHEIRTPMNGIIGLTNILLNTKMDEEQMGYLKSVKTCSDNLMVIINDILDLSKIEAGKMNFEKVIFKVEDIVKHAWALFSPKSSEKNISLQYEIDKNIPSIICGDPTRLSQILNNLVSNSIKFTSEGSVTIGVKLRSERETNITIDFEVTDTGIGIPEQSLSTIFENFTQASSDISRKFGGTGLGLSIVKRLVELQGGSIGVKSKLGVGTTFYFHLTYNRADENEIKHPSYDQRNDLDVSHLNILIAEDNAINQMVVKKLFADWGATIEFADNGAIAVDKLSKGNFDIVLMDIQMPVMDGYIATEKIRTELPEPFRNIPILAMTASISSEKTRCFDCGMNDYIIKPFDPLNLKKKLIDWTSKEIPTNGNDSSNKEEISQGETLAMVSLVKDDLIPQAKMEEIAMPESKMAEQNNSSASEVKIDLVYLKQISGNNAEFIMQMIEMFLQKTPEALEEMNEKFKKQSWEELRNVAHRIKPSYTYVGLGEINKMLAEIERCSQSQTNLETLPALIEQVSSKSKDAFKALEEELVRMK